MDRKYVVIVMSVLTLLVAAPVYAGSELTIDNSNTSLDYAEFHKTRWYSSIAPAIPGPPTPPPYYFCPQDPLLEWLPEPLDYLTLSPPPLFYTECLFNLFFQQPRESLEDTSAKLSTSVSPCAQSVSLSIRE